MEIVAKRIKAPLLINLVENGKTPFLPRSRLEKLGFKIAIYPATGLLTVAKALQRQFARMKTEDGYGLNDDKITFEELKTLVGFPAYYEQEERYRA
jgi:2-methylisocitrate lyase-like PEP mutase family enzyme